jgi:uncharacterized protein (DUF1501 family)
MNRLHCPPDSGRRAWLRVAGAGLALGLPGARLALAATPRAGVAHRPERLVVVLLRGALDGLAAVPAVGDPAWAALRPPIEADIARDGAPLPLDGFFALHPGLPTLHRWYGEGALLVVHAVASAYRERSHFDAQQLLESGGARPFELNNGWLGRALAIDDRQGVALSPGLPLALRGAPGSSSWAPARSEPPDMDLIARVQRLYHADPALGPAFQRATEQHLPGTGSGMADSAMATGGGGNFASLAAQAGRFLAADDGPAVAWLDSNGWDTHTQQAPRLARLLPALDGGLAALRSELGPRWAHTTVLVMTEFGRSAVLNGSGGSDHGTAGVAFVAGGAVAGGRVLADWPGLGRQQLFEARDLRATTDLRALIRPVIQRQLGLSTAQLERSVLPGAPAALAGLWRSPAQASA